MKLFHRSARDGTRLLYLESQRRVSLKSISGNNDDERFLALRVMVRLYMYLQTQRRVSLDKHLCGKRGRIQVCSSSCEHFEKRRCRM